MCALVYKFTKYVIINVYYRNHYYKLQTCHILTVVIIYWTSITNFQYFFNYNQSLINNNTYYNTSIYSFIYLC